MRNHQTHTHVYVCTYVRLCIFIWWFLMCIYYTCVYMCMFIYVYRCMCTCVHVCTCTRVYIHIRVCIPACVYTHTHTFIPIQGCTIGWITTVFYAQELCLHKLMDLSKIMQLHYNVIILYHRASYVGYLGHLVDTWPPKSTENKLEWCNFTWMMYDWNLWHPLQQIRFWRLLRQRQNFI